TGISVIPIIVTTLPVTTGGNNFTKYEKNGDIIITIIPDKNIEPYNTLIPCVFPTSIMGATAVNVQPKTTGSPIPIPLYTCRNVATPHINMSIATKYATSSGVKSNAEPTIIGTIIAPAYIANKCWTLSMKFLILFVHQFVNQVKIKSILKRMPRYITRIQILIYAMIF